MHDLVIRGGTVVDGTGAAPVLADVAVDDGTITEVGLGVDRGRREIDAGDLTVTPGFVDVHTHYDGQATWDPLLAPSSLHGVTTVVMGNCGVGFAPIRPGREEWLIGLMEGVEDIPGTALSIGMRWGWESFPEYLDELDRQSRLIDVATQVPHGALRAYVMGDRGADNEPATPEDIAEMRRLVAESIEAGALGVSTSRTVVHRAVDGRPVPGTFAAEEELQALAGALQDAGTGLLELAPAGIVGEDLLAPDQEIAWMRRVSLRTGRPVTFLLQQNDRSPEHWRTALEYCTEANAEGAQLMPQVAPRPIMLLSGLQNGLHPFTWRPSYRRIAHLPLPELVRELRDPEVKRRILAEERDPAAPSTTLTWDPARLFRLGASPEYEPGPDDSVAAQAARAGRDPMEFTYDLMLGDEGRELLMLPSLNYSHGNLDAVYDMLLHPAAIIGGSDGGAHCSIVSDASNPTFLLTHWTRDRSRGPRLPIEVAVNMQTRRTAAAFGLTDRGVLAPGMKADLNVLDLDGLRLHRPEMVHDLPGGARRLVQTAAGYVATVVSGAVVLENGGATDARPGRLVRGRPARAAR